MADNFSPAAVADRDARQGRQVVGFHGVLHAEQQAQEGNPDHDTLVIRRHYPIAMADFPLNHHGAEHVQHHPAGKLRSVVVDVVGW